MAELMPGQKRVTPGAIAADILLVVWFVFSLFPILWMVLLALKTSAEENRQSLDKNSALIVDLRSQLTDSESENARLSQRIEMLKSNADASQKQIDELLRAIDEKKAELDRLGVDYQSLLGESERAKSALSDAESRLDSQSAQLTEYEQQLDAYRDELQKKQGPLEQMVGV